MAYSEAQRKATDKYKAANYKRIPLDVPIKEYDAIKEAATAAGVSVNGIIREAVKEKIGYKD